MYCIYSSEEFCIKYLEGIQDSVGIQFSYKKNEQNSSKNLKQHHFCVNSDDSYK